MPGGQGKDPPHNRPILLRCGVVIRKKLCVLGRQRLGRLRYSLPSQDIKYVNPHVGRVAEHQTIRRLFALLPSHNGPARNTEVLRHRFLRQVQSNTLHSEAHTYRRVIYLTQK